MKRKRQDAAQDPHGVRARALEAATEILTAQGLDRLNLRTIADKAEIGLASIYYYFAGKEDLLLSLALAGFEEVRKDLADAAAQMGDDPFRAGARVYLGFSQRKPAIYGLMYDARLLSRHAVLREAEAATFRRFQEVIRRDRRFPADKADAVAWALWVLGRGVSAMASSQEGGRLTPQQQQWFSEGANYLINRQ